MNKTEKKWLRELVLPALEYGALQAEYTFDKLVRDKEPFLKGTPSLLTIRLKEARDDLRVLLDNSP